MAKKDTQAKEQENKFKFKGKYIQAIGRRKTAVAQVRLYPKGGGQLVINNVEGKEYFANNLDKIIIINQPLKLTGHLEDVDLSILVRGGGKKSQAEACRHGIARALVEMNVELRPALKAKGWLTRDARKKERKKPGLKKARRAPQWSKR